MTTERAEDYIEAIYELIEKEGEARTKEIATKLEVKPPSVSEMLQKLKKQGLVDYNKYKAIELTKKGKELAKNINETHRALKRFFRTIQVPEDIAEKDACRSEHKLDYKTIEQLKKFSRFLNGCPKNPPEWVNHFERYSKKGDRPEECLKNCIE